jgi:hypothetical protein
LFKKVSNRIEFPDGTKQFAKTIYSKPEEYFTETVMAKLEEHVKKEYQYGLGSDSENGADEEPVVEDELAESLSLIDSEVE